MGAAAGSSSIARAAPGRLSDRTVVLKAVRAFFGHLGKLKATEVCIMNTGVLVQLTFTKDQAVAVGRSELTISAQFRELTVCSAEPMLLHGEFFCEPCIVMSVCQSFNKTLPALRGHSSFVHDWFHGLLFAVRLADYEKHKATFYACISRWLHIAGACDAMSEEHRKRCGLGPLQGLCNSLLSDGDAGGSDGDDVVLIEELSVEEVERRKLERAKREGALVDLVSSDDDGVSVIDLVSSDDNDKGRGRKRKAQEKRKKKRKAAPCRGGLRPCL